ncbi:GAG-binding domain-containing protein, partial [Streptococcus oralis]|uniref:GAG-binding domain-containing protein n=1 Tax=Streptococcus oralis TaxID=1303 RepID=UPI001430734C
MFKSNHERRMRYSIRKFSVGVASVLVASFFMGSVAHASELVKDDSVKTTEIAAKSYPSMAQTDHGNKSSSSELETTKMDIPTINIKEAVEPIEKTAITASQNDEERESTEKVTAEKTKETDSSKSNDNKAKVEELKNRLKNQINQSPLSENEKKDWLASIDDEEDTDNLQTLEYGFKKFIQKKQEQTSKQSDTKVDLGNIDKELNHQKSQVEKMAEQKGITNEDKDSMLKKIEDIRKQAQQADKKEDAEVKVREELGKLFSSTKAGLDQEIQEHVKKETSSEENTQKVDEHYATSLQNLAQKSLEELDKATTNEQAKQIKNQFLENAQELKETQSKINEANIELYGKMAKYLDEVEKTHSTADMKNLVEQAKKITEEYKEKISAATNREEVTKLKQEADAKLKEAVEMFKKNAATSEQDKPKRRAKRGDLGELATPDKKENDARSGWGGIIDGSGELLGGFSEIKEKLEKEIDESSLTSEQKKSYKGKIAKVEENDVDGLLGVHREYLNQLDFQYTELSKVKEELKYQEEQIQRMFEQKGITNEDKDAMLKKIAEIRQEAQKDIKASEGYRDKLNGAKVKFLQNLDKLFTSTKSKFEKEMQELYRKKEEEIVKEKHLEKDKIYDDADVQKLRELEKDALKKLDEAKTNDEALRVKLEFARNVEKNSQQVQKVKVDDKLQELIKEAKRELEKLNQGIAEVDKLPELPANDSDYMVQKKYIWDEDKETIPKKIAKFKENLGNKTYTKESLQKFIDDCIYYQTHAKIEVMTRKVAGYRKAYPNNPEIEKEFVRHIKQTSSLTYASLENDSLKRYFEKDFAPAFERIKQIVEGLEKPQTPAHPGTED